MDVLITYIMCACRKGIFGKALTQSGEANKNTFRSRTHHRQYGFTPHHFWGFHKSGAGFTLIEMVIYTALVGVIALALTSFLLSNLKAYNKAEARQHVFNNLNSAMKLITDEIRFAHSVYTPTSVFNSNTGQLSLETLLNPPAGESTAYVDYYLDNGRIYEKREGQTASPLTSELAKMTAVRFTHITAASSADSLTVQLTGQIYTQSTAPEDQASMTLTTSASLRGAY